MRCRKFLYPCPFTIANSFRINNLIGLGHEAYHAKSQVDQEVLSRLLPAEDDWKKICEPFLDVSPLPALTVTSVLQGACQLVEPSSTAYEVAHDAEGLSGAVRVALFAVRLTTETTILDIVSPAQRHAVNLYLPLILQIVNEKLDISKANEAWIGDNQEIEDEMSQMVIAGRQLFLDLVSAEASSDTLSARPERSTMEACWLEQLHTIDGRSAQSYRLAAAASEILSLCIDRNGPSRYVKIMAEDLGALRKSPNIFKSAALVVIGKLGLLPLAKLCTELTVDITNKKPDTAVTPGKSSSSLQPDLLTV